MCDKKMSNKITIPQADFLPQKNKKQKTKNKTKTKKETKKLQSCMSSMHKSPDMVLYTNVNDC